MLRPLAFLVFAFIVTACQAAVVLPFTPMGAADPLVNGISTEWVDGTSHLFVTTEEGFYAYDFDAEVWDDHTLPDWIGVARYAVIPVRSRPDRLVLGGVNAWFKGTLWYSDDGGDDQVLTRESDGGRVTGMAQSIDPAVPLIYACTWSDIVDGELLRSVDDGATWTPETGHGHHAMTDVAVVGDHEIYVTGDNYLTRTFDDGGTWENLQANLPAGQGLYCLLAQEPMTALPKNRREDPMAAFLMVSNDSGLYFSDAAELDWERVLPSSCRAVAYRFIQIDVFVYWSEFWAVTFDGRLLFCEGLDWDNWLDVTPMFAPGDPIDMAVSGAGVYVLTREHGVYHSTGSAYPTQAPDVPAELVIRAAPNPFNPRTVVSFDLPEAGPVELCAYDLAGRRVATLVGGSLPAGRHSRVWNGAELPSGLYVLRLKSGQAVSTLAVSLVR